MSCIAAATEEEDDEESGDTTEGFDSLVDGAILLLLELPPAPETAGMFIGPAEVSLELAPVVFTDENDDRRLVLEVAPDVCGCNIELGAGEGGGVGPKNIKMNIALFHLPRCKQS